MNMNTVLVLNRKLIKMDNTQVYNIVHIASGIYMTGTIDDLIIKACVIHIQAQPSKPLFKFVNIN